MYKIYKRTFPDGRVYIGCTSKSLNARMGMAGMGYASSPFYKEYTAEDWEQVTTTIVGEYDDVESARAAESQAIQDFLNKHPREQLLNTQLNSTYSWDAAAKKNLGDTLKASEPFQTAAQDTLHRQRISSSIKEKWKDPAYRNAVIEGLHKTTKAGNRTPIARRRISKSLKAYHNNRDNRAKFLASQRTPERRAKLSASIRNSEKHKASCVNAERNKKLSNSLKRYYAIPGNREANSQRLKNSEKFQKAVRDPARLAKISKAASGRRAIHKEGERKFVRPEELNAYLEQGWELGLGALPRKG